MPMQNQSDINRQLFDKVNELKSSFDETNGYLKGHIEINDKLFALLDRRDKGQARIIYWLIGVVFFMLAVITYGAIGKDGLFSVRDAMPRMAALPAHNDFDKYASNNHNNKEKKQ